MCVGLRTNGVNHQWVGGWVRGGGGGGVDSWMITSRWWVGGEWAWVVKQDERVGVVLHINIILNILAA